MKPKPLTLSEAQRTGRIDEFIREEEKRLGKKRGKDSLIRRTIKRMSGKRASSD